MSLETKNEGSPTTWLVAMLVAVLAALGLAPSSSNSIKPASTEASNITSPASDGTKYEFRPLVPLCRYLKEANSPPKAPDTVTAKGQFAVTVGKSLQDGSLTLQFGRESTKQSCQRADQACIKTTLEQVKLTLKEGYRIRFLISMVPDPIDSAAPFLFDEMTNAIRLAAQQAGFEAERYYLPWIDAEDLKSSDPSYRRKPGLLLFRRDPKAANSDVDLLGIFIVGETQTRGANRRALGHCFELIARFEESSCEGLQSTSVAHIVGPTFTGSARSIQLTLQEIAERQREHFPQDCQPHQFTDARIISGSATAIREEELEPHIRAKDGVILPPVPKVEYNTTLHSHQVTFDCSLLRNYLIEDQKVRPEEILILKEVGTGFARGNQTLIRGVRYLEFPYNISQLRGAIPMDDASSSKSNQVVANEFDISPDLEGGERSVDVFPIFDPNRTLAVDEMMLNRTVAQIETHTQGVRFVGFIASDPRDTIFLAKICYRIKPDVRFFVAEPNLLLSHPQYTYFLRGSLVAATYPLFLPNQYWSYGNKGSQKTRAFASDACEGTYNAVLIHLSEIYGKTLDGKSLLEDLCDYGSPFEPNSKTPPVWISEIANNGTWPIRCYGAAGDFENDTICKVRTPKSCSLPHPLAIKIDTEYKVIMSAMFGVAIVVGAVCLLRLRKEKQGDVAEKPASSDDDDGYEKAKWISAFHFGNEQDHSLGTACLRAFSWFFLLATGLSFYYPVVNLAFASEPWRLGVVDTLFVVVTGLLLLGLLAATLVAFAYIFVKKPTEDTSDQAKSDSRKYKVLAIGALLFPAFFSLFLPVDLNFSPPLGKLSCSNSEEILSNQFLLWFRSTSLLSGISVVVPLVLLSVAATCWCLMNFARLKIGKAINRPFILDQFPSSLPILCDVETKEETGSLLSIASQFASPLFKAAADGAWVILVFLFAYLYITRKATTSLDVNSDFLEGYYWLVATLLLSQTILWGMHLNRLRRFLGLLEHFPLKDSIERLPRGIRGLTKRLFDGERPNKLLKTMIISHVKRFGSGDHLQYEREVVEQLTAKWQSIPEGTNWQSAKVPSPEKPLSPSKQKAALVQSRYEDYVALCVVEYLSYQALLLKRITNSLVLGVVLLLLAVSSYPLIPQKPSMIFMLIWLGGIAVFAIRYLIIFDRHPVISTLAGTPLGTLTLDVSFFQNSITFLLPLLTLLAAALPSFSTGTWRLVEPIMRLFH